MLNAPNFRRYPPWLRLGRAASFPVATPARRVGSFRGYPFVMIFLAGVDDGSSDNWQEVAQDIDSGPDHNHVTGRTVAEQEGRARPNRTKYL